MNSEIVCLRSWLGDIIGQLETQPIDYPDHIAGCLQRLKFIFQRQVELTLEIQQMETLYAEVRTAIVRHNYRNLLVQRSLELKGVQHAIRVENAEYACLVKATVQEVRTRVV